MYSKWVTADTDPFRPPSSWLGLGQQEPPKPQGPLVVPCQKQSLFFKGHDPEKLRSVEIAEEPISESE